MCFGNIALIGMPRTKDTNLKTIILTSKPKDAFVSEKALIYFYRYPHLLHRCTHLISILHTCNQSARRDHCLTISIELLRELMIGGSFFS